MLLSTVIRAYPKRMLGDTRAAECLTDSMARRSMGPDSGSGDGIRDHTWRDHRRWILAFAAALLAVAAACTSPGDTSMYASSSSDRVWLLKVPRAPTDDTSFWVVRVRPRADAFAFSWIGTDVSVQILREDCSVAGTMMPQPDGTYASPDAPGLTARLEAHGAPIGSRDPSSGVEDVEECGGTLLH